jgi:hypothetical protein
MRVPRFFSPSALSLFERDREEYYMKYLAPVRAPRIPQAIYMSIGSAFDAYVKAELYSAIFGSGTNSEFEFDTIFVEQVEEHNRDWARDHGKYVFDCYKQAGAYDDLLEMLLASEYEPQFEFTVTREVEGVPLLGKPDCRFIHENGTHVILDWKVNGYCSKHGASPYKYYAKIRDGWDEKVAKKSRGCNSPHPKFDATTLNNLEISGYPLEQTSTDWATQLAIYSWMLGEPVGDENVLVAIDQIVAKPRPGARPLLRMAQHRSRISEEYQKNLIERLKYAWKCVSTGYIFDDLERDVNDQRCAELDAEASALLGDGSQDSDWLTSVCRPTRFF